MWVMGWAMDEFWAVWSISLGVAQRLRITLDGPRLYGRKFIRGELEGMGKVGWETLCLEPAQSPLAYKLDPSDFGAAGRLRFAGSA